MKVFAGDNSKPAADASYRNLSWENFHVDHSFDIGTKIQKGKEIGTIDSWGPFYHISFDLIIHSLKIEDSLAVSNILNFIEDGEDQKKEWGDFLNVPSIFLYRSGYLEYWNFVDNQNEFFQYNIELNQWYNIVIEKKAVNGKVIEL